MKYTLGKTPKGARGLYEDGVLVATWDRKEDSKQIDGQIALRAGMTEVEYSEIQLDTLSETIEVEEDSPPKKATRRPRAPKNRLDDPSEPSPARIDN